MSDHMHMLCREYGIEMFQANFCTKLNVSGESMSEKLECLEEAGGRKDC